MLALQIRWIAAIVLLFVIGGCSVEVQPFRSLNDQPPSSPRVVPYGVSVPKGGGRFKVGKPYMVGGKTYVPRVDPTYDQVGIASWYGVDFHGRKTANGEIYDSGALTGSHVTLPLPSYVYVTNLENGRTIMVRLNDRGPFVEGRIIDLSKRAAELLLMKTKGLARVRVRYAGTAPLDGNTSMERRFLARQAWYR